MAHHFLKQVQVRSRSHWFNVHMSDIVELQMYHSNYACYACYFFTKKSYKNRVQPWQSIRLSPTEGGLPIMIICTISTWRSRFERGVPVSQIRSCCTGMEARQVSGISSTFCSVFVYSMSLKLFITILLIFKWFFLGQCSSATWSGALSHGPLQTVI